MNPTLTIPWSVPITDYWLFYLVFGIIGFVLCFYSRFFITFVVPLLLWFCIADLRSFYHQDLGSKQLGPQKFHRQKSARSSFAWLQSFLGTSISNRTQ